MSHIKAGMQDNMIKRLMSVLIVMLLIFAVVRCSFGVIAATGYADVTVQHDGKTVKSITVVEGHKETIKAVRPSRIDICEYQWQVRTVDGLWVDIYEQTSETLEVSDAVLDSILDDAGSAYIRCKVISGDFELASDACRVTISYNVTDDIVPSEIEYYDAADYGRNDITDAETSEADTEAADETYTESTDAGVSADEAVATATDAAESVVRSAPRKSAPVDGVTVISDDEPALIADTDEVVTVTINYLDAVSQNKIYSSYIASMSKDSKFDQTVTFPTYVGYVPYWKSDEWDATDSYTTNEGGERVAIDPDKIPGWSAVTRFDTTIDKVSRNYVINIYYFASNVSWKAEYYFQNIYDDNYTIRTSAMKTGMAKTGTIVDDTTLTRDVEATGFTKLYHYPEAVAADGSTVFECYYDRNYYLINFDLDGGHGVDPIYARYETPYVVNEPTRFGYKFMGWLEGTQNDDGTVTYGNTAVKSSDLPGTIQPRNIIYKAQWEKTTASYTVVYWKENAEPNDDGDYGYSYWASETRNAEVETEVRGSDLAYTDTLNSGDTVTNKTYPEYKNLKDYSYFTYNAERTESDGTYIVSGDNSTVVNVYYSRNKYTLRFYYARNEINTKTWELAGGSTEKFSTIACDNSEGENIRKKLESIDGTYQYKWGVANQEPQLNESGNGKGYTKGYATYGNYKYAYIEFTEKYKSDISDLWPCNVFDKVGVTGMDNGDYAYFSAWTVENFTEYNKSNSNKTIKGLYMRLDENILYQSQYMTKLNEQENPLVVFLAFWENGASGVGWNVPYEWIYKTYLEVLDADDKTGAVEKNGKYYKLDENKTVTSYDNNDWNGYDWQGVDKRLLQTATGIEGFYHDSKSLAYRNAYNTPDDANHLNGKNTTDKISSYTMEFYYDRNVYDFKFQNNGVQTNVISVPYGTLLGDYSPGDKITYTAGTTTETKNLQEFFREPTYPDRLEQGAYEFEGWYTTPTHSEGTKLDADMWGSYTMPASDVVLYANWVPVEHMVNCFLSYDYMLAYEKEVAENPDEAADILQRYIDEKKCLHTKSVSHGNVYGSINNPTAYMDESGLELTFDGWFYMENGDKKAYTPLNMPVNKDMNVFADWGSHTPQPYVLHYVLYNAVKDGSSEYTLLQTASKNSPQENVTYTISKDGDSVSYLYVSGGYHEFVAADTNGYAYQGSTRTFTAKAGNPYNQLYAAYNDGYYPTVATHSITVAYEEHKLYAVNNVYTFFYVNVESVSYTVRYINKESGLSIFGDETVPDEKKNSNNAVVTERFKVIDGYLPDAFYKRLVLSVQEENGEWVGSDDNVITFYYTENTTSAYYAVHFMLQNMDTDGTDKTFGSDGNYAGGDYTESDYMIEGIATVDGTKAGSVEISPYTFTGFSLAQESDNSYSPCTAIKIVDNADGSTSITSAMSSYEDGKYTVSVNNRGTDIYIFYDRQSYDYTVYYLMEGTTISSYSDLAQYKIQTEDNNAKVLRNAETMAAEKYGKTITAVAAAITGYNCTTAKTQSLVIGAKTQHDEEKGYTPNYIIFYYTKEKYTVEYKAVPETGGSLTKYNVTFEGQFDSKKNSLDSTPTAGDGFKFDGWYLDEACRIPADTEYSDDNGNTYKKADISGDTITPNADYLDAAPATNVFYAKFTRSYGSLTIERSNISDEGNGSQVFVYEIKNTDTRDIITITIKDGDEGSKTIKDLPYGTYEVRQVDSWSWRYKDDATNVQKVTIGGENTSQRVTYDNSAKNESWMSANSVSIENLMQSDSDDEATTQRAVGE